MRNLTILFYCAMVSACSSLIEEPNSAYILEILQASDTPAQEAVDILALSNDLRAFVDNNVDRKWPSSKRLRTLRDILFSPEHFDIKYESGTTKTAIETYQTRSGNCLSMTNLYIAMARYSGINAEYHIVDAIPQWDHSGNTLILTRHINSTGQLRNGDNYILDFLPNLRTNQETAETVSDTYALAIYYNNLGAEALITHQDNLALQQLKMALVLEPNMADIWNNMGILQRRLKRLDLAEASFKQSFKLDRYSNAAVSNLSNLYHAAGQLSKAEELAKRVARYRERNPYYRYSNARLAHKDEQFQKSLEELQHAIKLNPNEIVFFELLAKVHKELGNTKKERDSLKVIHYLKGKKSRIRSSLEIRHPGNALIN